MTDDQMNSEQTEFRLNTESVQNETSQRNSIETSYRKEWIYTARKDETDRLMTMSEHKSENY